MDLRYKIKEGLLKLKICFELKFDFRLECSTIMKKGVSPSAIYCTD